MDRNTVIGILLIGALLVGMMICNQPSKDELEAQKRKQDSIALVRQATDTVTKVQQQPQAALIPVKDSVVVTPVDTTKQLTDSAKVNLNEKELGAFSKSGTDENKFFVLENELIKVKISSKGGKIYSVELKQYHTYDGRPLMMFDEETAKFGFNFFSVNRNISTEDLYFKPAWIDSKTKDKDSIFIKGNDSVRFAMRLYPDDCADKTKYLEFLYTLKGNSYMIGYTLNFTGVKDIISPVYKGSNFIDLVWENDLILQEKAANTFNGATVYYKYHKDDEVDYLSETKDDDEELKTSVKWVSYKQPFFVSSLIADNNFENANIKTFTDAKRAGKDYYLRSMRALIGVPFNPSAEKQSIAMHFYYGPNKYKTLRQYKLDLERQIPLGWSFFLMAWINRFAVIPVFNFLEGFNMNYGIIILILTILLKIVLFPIAYKTYISSAKMRILKPEIDEIGKKFPKREDAIKKQQATMALYKKAGANPMAGCVPMLLQFPILIALFRFFPASIELRQQSFLWADDLSSYDSIYNLPFNIPFYGAHISLFTLLMTASTIIYTRMNNQMMSSSQQMPGMKTMMYIMPIMFLGMFNSYAAGLSYYYFLANVLTFGQVYLIRKFIDEDKIHKQIQENKAKPVSAHKSGFQKKLEEMAKKRGYNPNNYKRK